MNSSDLNENSIMDLTNKNLFAYISGCVKLSADGITELFNLTPIMYDDGNYSYSSLNLIMMSENLFIAPFELIESVPVQAGK